MSKNIGENIKIESLSLEKAQQLLFELRTRQTDLENQNHELKLELAVLRDQSPEREHTEESLFAPRERREQDERVLPPGKGLLRCIIDTVGDLIYVKDLDGVYRGCNKAAERFIGIKESEQIGKTDFDFFSQDIAATIRDKDRHIVDSGHEHRIEEWVPSPDGKNVFLETKKAAFYGPDGNLSGIVGISRDITARKQAEDELRKSQKQFQDITAQSPLPIVITDAKGDIEFFNNKFIEIFGYTLEDISTAEKWWMTTYPDEAYRQEVQESWIKAIEKASEAGVQIETQEWDITCKNGSVRRVEFDMMPLDNISVIVMNDITDRKKAELALRESNEELDAFVRTIAHDLRTPMSPIIGYTDILREDYKEQLGEQGLNYLSEIERAGTEILSMMEDLLSLAQAVPLKRPAEHVSTREVVTGVIKNLKNDISRAGTVIQIGPLPTIHVPKTFMIQIFDNLIGNAIRYAGNSGGIVEIGGEQTGKQVRYYVCDHGLGIPEQDRNHIFEIFYRGANKGEVTGTGIGLAIVYKIARNFGGRAWVEETIGGGCTFWVEMEDATHP